MSELLHKGRKYVLIKNQIINDFEVLFEVLGKGEKTGTTFKVECRCTKCGTIKFFVFQHLLRESSTLCCCSHPNKHGESRTRLYNAWNAIKGRCYNKNNPAYQYYGVRGVNICNEWRYDYKLFKGWALDSGYQQGLTLERKNPKGDYCPENCCWITRADQSRNIGKTSRNKTGATGVSFNKRDNAYIAGWRADGENKRKYFSVRMHGEEEAFELACEYREKMIQELKDKGVYYGENHGK